MTSPPAAARVPRVLLERDGFVAIDKPAGWATMAREGQDLRAWAKESLPRVTDFIGFVHRLDKDVSGVTLAALDRGSAARLSRQFRDRTVTKTYLALVESAPTATAGVLIDWLEPLPSGRSWRACGEPGPGRREATLEYSLVGEAGGYPLLAVWPLTGRTHQIRVQLSARGSPIVGDRRYGARQSFPFGVALHAHALEIVRPCDAKRVRIVAEPPNEWSLSQGSIDEISSRRPTRLGVTDGPALARETLTWVD